MASKTKAAAVARGARRSTPTGAAEKAGATVGSLIVLQKNALSTDVGPAVISTLFKSGERTTELTQEMNQLKTRSRAELSRLVLGIVKLGMNDKSVDLANVYSGDAKAQGKLNNQVCLALGIKVEKAGEAGKDGTVPVSVVYNPELSYAFPMQGENEKSPNYRQRNTFRTNFLTQLKKAICDAHTILATKMEAKYDAKAGTLMISGPAVKKHYGQDQVLIDERQKYEGADKKTIELTEKPSFTSLANIGSALVGAGTVAAGTTGNNTRGAQPGTTGGAAALESAKAAQVTGRLPMDKALQSIAKSLAELLGKVSSVTKEARAVLIDLRGTIDKKLA